MPKQKYDWAAIKAEYLSSPQESPHNFMKEKFGKVTGTMSTCIVGWGDERRALREQAQVEAAEQLKQRMMKELAMPLERLFMQKREVFEKVNELLQGEPVLDEEGNAQFQEVTTTDTLPDGTIRTTTMQKQMFKAARLSASELRHIYIIIKTELGEPVNISELSGRDGSPLIPPGGGETIFYIPVNGKETKGARLPGINAPILQGAGILPA